MSAGSQQSGRASLVFAIAFVVVAFMIWEHFDCEERILGYRYSSYFWDRFCETVASIPEAIQMMLDKVRSI